MYVNVSIWLAPSSVVVCGDARIAEGGGDPDREITWDWPPSCDWVVASNSFLSRMSEGVGIPLAQHPSASSQISPGREKNGCLRAVPYMLEVK